MTQVRCWCTVQYNTTKAIIRKEVREEDMAGKRKMNAAQEAQEMSRYFVRYARCTTVLYLEASLWGNKGINWTETDARASDGSDHRKSNSDLICRQKRTQPPTAQPRG